LMINCLFPPPNVRLACPPDTSGTGLDCNGDGHFALDDVFCCARAMLGTPGPNVPPGRDSLRAAPDIAVRFGLPRAGTDGTLEVPLVLSGMAGVAAARLDVRYPDARYDILGVDFTGAPTSWWTMHEVISGRVGLAILDLAGLDAPGGPAPAIAAAPPVEARVRLRLRAGAVAGGELTLAGHEFAAGDGVTLATPNAEGSVQLGTGGRVALTMPRPNPFAASTWFALTLPLAGPVDVGVFNAAGRRVVTLLREDAATAGVYTLAWNGADEGGGRAPGGVYFVRVVTGAGDTARKLLFLPGAAR
ncbi:MAG: T9SS type A sorting domain-containing protein, partial [Candidatus Eisenbacteria bacterium]